MLGDFLILCLSQDLFLPSSRLAFACHLGVSARRLFEEGLLGRGVLTPSAGVRIWGARGLGAHFNP